MKKLKMILVGCGGMGHSHATGLLNTGRVELGCVVDRDAERARQCQAEFKAARWGTDFAEELKRDPCDFALVAAIPSQHAGLSIRALEHGLHVYCEKPIAATLADGDAMITAARRTGAKLFIGHQLRYCPLWMKVVKEIRAGLLGFPIVMRMTGNQQTFDATWETQKGLIRDTSPLIDCGTHYVNLMLAMNPSAPKLVCAMGTSVARDIPWPAHHNYGLLQVKFEDGSVGHYETGWGPMMTQNAWYIKDFSGPRGSLSLIVELDHNTPDNPPACVKETLHYRKITDNQYKTVCEEFQTHEESVGKAESLRGAHTCFLEAIERDLDLTPQMEEAHLSLKVVLAADRSIREERMIPLE